MTSQSVSRRVLRRLRPRIFLWMSLIALGPLVVMAAQGYHCAREAIMESQAAYLSAIAGSKTLQLENWLRERKADMAFLATIPCVRSDHCISPSAGESGDACGISCDILEHVRRRSPSYEDIAILNASMEAVARTGMDSHPGLDPPSVDFLNELEGSDGYALGAPHLHADGSIGVHAGQPIVDVSGRKIGYAVANLNLSAIADPILEDRSGLGETGKALLLASDGRPLGLRDSDAPIVRDLGGAGSHAGHHAAIAALEYRDPQGSRVLGARSEAPELGATLVVEMDRAEVFSWFGILLRRAALTGLVAFLLVVALAVWISRHLSRPLQRLAYVARRVASGQYDERMGPMEDAEAAEVGAAFNQMLDELAEKERRLVHAATLAAVGELSSSIVHEMRNPLSSVKLNLQALRRMAADDPTRAELGEIASQQAERLERMLSELLDYGKPLQFEVSSLEPRQVMEDAARSVQSEAQAKRIRLEIEDNAGGARILADAETLSRALTNLVENAIHASPVEGAVRLEASLMNGLAPRIGLSVSDAGAGLSENVRRNLFRPFFTTRPDGVGLGLANVKKIAEYHGGSIEALTRPDGGAVFTLSLPARHRA